MRAGGVAARLVSRCCRCCAAVRCVRRRKRCPQRCLYRAYLPLFLARRAALTYSLTTLGISTSPTVRLAFGWLRRLSIIKWMDGVSGRRWTIKLYVCFHRWDRTDVGADRVGVSFISRLSCWNRRCFLPGFLTSVDLVKSLNSFILYPPLMIIFI